jgi:hypothetical protein
MPLPTPEKTWTWAHVVADLTGTRTGDLQSLMYKWKEALKALPVPCTVAGSNDGTTAGMDAVDRWDAPGKITFSGVAGASWIVLEFPGWGGGQLLVYSTNGGSFSALTRTQVSPGGLFTGGNTTTVPTASDAETYYEEEWLDLNVNVAGAPMACHIAATDDGENTRWFNCSNGAPNTFMVFETVGAPAADWSDPRCWGRGPRFIRQNPPLGALWVIENGTRRWLKMLNPADDTIDFNIYTLHHMAAQRHIYDSITCPGPTEIDGSYPLWSWGITGFDDGNRGKLGYIKDWWFTVPAANPEDDFPDDSSREFMVIGSGIVMPWDGTVPDFT